MRNPFTRTPKRIIEVKRGEMTAEDRKQLAVMADAIVVEVSEPGALHVVEEPLRQPQGKRDAVFLPDMTEEEESEYIKDTELGWGKFKEKLRNVGKAIIPLP